MLLSEKYIKLHLLEDGIEVPYIEGGVRNLISFIELFTIAGR